MPEQVVHMPFTLNTPQFEAGKYRVRVYLNGERHEDRELVANQESS